MNNATEALVTILSAVVGVTVLAVLVSRRANTAGVLSAGGNAFSQILGVAVSPVTGSAFATPTSSLGGMGGVPLQF